MGENTGGGLVLGRAALEDARQVIGWAVFDAADCWCQVERGEVRSGRDDRALLVDCARVGRLLGEPGDPAVQERPLARDERVVLSRAAEALAEKSACFAADEPEDRARVTFHEARLDACWRVLLLLEPPEWRT